MTKIPTNTWVRALECRGHRHDAKTARFEATMPPYSRHVAWHVHVRYSSPGGPQRGDRPRPILVSQWLDDFCQAHEGRGCCETRRPSS